MEYVFEGPHPVEDAGELVHPGDRREFDAEPDWGPWRRTGPEAAPPPPPPPAPPPAPVTPLATPAKTEGGM